MPDQPPRSRSGDDGVITLFLCGDVMTGRGVDQALPHPGGPRLCEPYVTSALEYVELAELANGPIRKPVEFTYIWGDALAELNRARPDVRIVNLETAVTKSEDCVPKGINYRMNPENAPCVTVAGIDCCVLANNHVLDWGRLGLVETLRTLERAKLGFVGAGHNIAEAQAPLAMPVPGRGRVLVYAYGHVSSGIPPDWAAAPDTPGVNLLPDLSQRTVGDIAGRMEREKRPGDIVVASIHWGGNWGYEVPRSHIEFAHGLIDSAGVDIVHGHSSHHAKGIEFYNGRPILYGCGDFLNDYEGISGYEEFRDDLVLMYLVGMTASDGRIARLHMYPFQIRNLRVHRASQKDARWLRDTLDRESRAFGSRIELAVDGSLSAVPK